MLIHLNILFTLFSLLGILATIIFFLGKLNRATLTLTKWFLISLGVLWLTWGLYNYVGTAFNLWQPLSLDQYINYILEKLHLKGIVDWLNRLLRGLP